MIKRLLINYLILCALLTVSKYPTRLSEYNMHTNIMWNRQIYTSASKPTVTLPKTSLRTRHTLSRQHYERKVSVFNETADTVIWVHIVYSEKNPVTF